MRTQQTRRPFNDAETRPQQVGSALIAAANYVNGVVATSPPASGASGNILGAALTITPKISGNFLVTWCASGPASASGVAVTFNVTVGGTPARPNASTGPGADGAHTLNSAGVCPISGQPLGTPVSINVAWTATGGTWGPEASGGAVFVQELAA